ncbi:cupin domain-containing protein [Actinomycetospora lemnae]|uniref:Cupin domain-containing protein n=1 Tax=Actinomycetospora lemnae TaxID=3019891 RepID=A0ABT5T2E8_9PSEU|nr:cupin domain-containing protein [Actinomycetospora sp. DW7H6]MDD7968885.1 cupin domain-containing protein [Actinomycetospora sp. DW7H6]
MSSLVHLPGAGRPVGPGIRIKVEPGDNEGFAVFESVLPPAWEGPPPHRHLADDEAFYVLEGTVAFLLDGVSHHCGPGSAVSVPRGSAHAFANPGSEPARVLVITTPEATRLVEAINTLVERDPEPSPQIVRALYRAHHTEITG